MQRLRAKVLSLFSRKPTATQLSGISEISKISESTEIQYHLELLSLAQRAQHSRELAETHQLQPGRSRNRLLAQLTENERVLFDVHALLVKDVEAEQRIMPAGEWLLDNFYVIEEQIRTARRHLPKGYSAELPHLRNTFSQGLPRAYDISLAAIAYGDGRMDPESLRAMVAAYQSVTVLNLGELWAIPIMLRLALIDKLRNVAGQIAADRSERSSANDWADEMIAVAADKPQDLILTIAEMARSTSLLTSSFVSELMRRLRGLGPALTLPLTWIEQRLSEQELTIEQLVRMENQLQASNQVSMSNCIGSLRTLDALNWKEFVETTSHVEMALLEDPAGAYARMDFMTRDRYRHVVEQLAKISPLSETDIAHAAVDLAQTAVQNTAASQAATPSLKRTTHVGYYLIDKGLPELEARINAVVPPCKRLKRACRARALPLYTGSIALLTGLVAVLFVALAHSAGASFVALCAIGLLALPGAAHLAIALVNWLATLLVTPHPLPRLDLSTGIPEELRTLVVVPTMLLHRQGIRSLIADLEVRFLANRDEHLHFALLTDFGDATQELCPEDDALLLEAQTRVETLNRKYPTPSGDTFALFHRPRLWNPQERVWMGYERKRGKLSALNNFLLHDDRSAFSRIVGDVSQLSGIRYVITLDTDTRLMRDSARQFVGSMAHPLNQACYDTERQRVVDGYGVLQPRVVAGLPGGDYSRYARLCSSDMGIDPYTRATSDVYQDVFGEGSFIGKGIYDVAIFELAIGGRLPDNRILSHDLLEGCYARSGLLSDVQLYEEYPARYESDASRRHRWIRGDWQIARWGLPNIPGPDANKGGKRGGVRLRTPLSGLSRWKILDNVRRSLTAVTMLGLLGLGWAVLPNLALWTVAVAGLVLLPSLLFATASLFQKSSDVTFRQHITSTLRHIPRHCSQSLFTLLCLPHEALYSMDAICRTLWRMGVSQRGLLEWKTSAEANRHDATDLISTAKRLWVGPVAAACAAVLALSHSAGQLAAISPLLLLWLASPGIVWWLSRPLSTQLEPLGATQQRFLRKLARKTWSFFETFVGQEDNWLPPDNHQEQPITRTAHRTSPTNIGLSLLANLSACDFGFITAGAFLTRTEQTFQTLNKLKRYRGHFLNWYDTRTLEPLPPQYVSTVDSGNLAGHLLTLRAGLAEMPTQPVFGLQIFLGLNDSLALAAESLNFSQTEPLLPLHTQLAALLQTPPKTLTATRLALQDLLTAATNNLPALPAQEQTAGTTEDSALCRWWLAHFVRQLQDALDDLNTLCPWLTSPKQPDLSAYSELDSFMTLRELAALDAHLPSRESPHAVLRPYLQQGAKEAQSRLERLGALQRQCGQFCRMDYDFLYDEERRLLTIGYNVDEHRVDAGYYDLLASEARLASFVAIAQGALPQANWFALGRLLTSSGGEPILLSWSGSMFEYLMPLLVMPSYEHTLLDETCKASVARQIDYGQLRSVPWGISECGYNAFDAASNYQYRAFGVPGLGLKRGLASDVVIAPYATALALLVKPHDACRNLERLSAEGFDSRHGLYEAIDYTPSRLPRGQSHGIVRSYMAHHQGMSLLALEHALLNAPMQRRFAAEPLFQATLPLLQERVPEVTASYVHTSRHPELKRHAGVQETPLRIFNSPHTPYPEVQLLSNGSYHVMLTNAGGGYSRWRNLAITRWNEDSTRDNWGTFCYIKDLTDNAFWSTAYQPLCTTPNSFQAIFSEGRAEFNRRDGHFDSHMEIVISSEDDIELRRVRVTNRSQQRRTIEVTSFAEIALAPPAADDLHPAFSKLFVQTQILPEQRAVLASRRARSADEATPWMLHTMAVHGLSVDQTSYETDRQQFIGRGRSAANPCVMACTSQSEGRLSGREGSVLDPIAAIRSRITLEGEQSVTIDMVTGIGETREIATGLVNKYRDRHIADRVFDMTWTHGQVLLRQLNASEADAQLYARLAGSIIYAHATLRATESVLLKNRRGQSGLWGYAISGDLPIVLLEIEDPENIELVRQLLQAHEYWRLKGLIVDLVIWNEDRIGYRQVLHDQIMGLITAGNAANLLDRPGGVFVRAADRITDEDRILFQTVARVILSDARGTLAEQVQGPRVKQSSIPLLRPTQSPETILPAAMPQARPDLVFYNGIGGFTPDGCEYVITTAAGGQLTPAPWVNVLANPHFGAIVSESGPACTWSENAHEFRLTPWNNDPVNDVRGEAFYLRDEERGTFWSPTPLPCRGTTPYVTRHGFGYSVFEHTEHGIESELRIYVDLDAAIKFAVLKLRNTSGRPRRLTATGYVEWVLGDLRSKSAMYTITERDSSGALLARNPYNTEFPGRTAFFAVDGNASFTCDRTEFIGRNGALDNPLAMRRARLSGRVGAGLEPCAAIQVVCNLVNGEERDIIFKLGVGKNPNDARALIRRFAGPEAARASIDCVWQHWRHALGAVHVETPDPSFNMLVNGWLLYQTLACRFWGRSATYQSGGAFGFRDQLQDTMALIHTRPDILREHLLLCAAHQFPEGDVQHWWHPPLDRGVRTHCSDDYLWLPLATCRYVLATADSGVLDETIHFIEGRELRPDEESYYDLPIRSEQIATLYEHCVRAIEHGLRFGVHGLPLMGSGDWNDGMDLVGEHGQGESVWLAFFLYEVLETFSTVALMRDDSPFAERCLAEAATLRQAIAEHGWDGEWYRRAYFDDGTPLGSASNAECRIDSIAQSWAVLSGAGEPERNDTAMDSLHEHLVDHKNRLVQLFTPPFDSSDLNPGYIKGYAPGVRENGGQYTHAAIWAAMAFAKQNDSNRAWELMDLINPINHARSPEEVAVYKVEPYVMAADVYAAPLHAGRGGWTWYTGSAAWMYRLMTESLLGLSLENNELYLNPCVPSDWTEFTVHYRFRETVYHITVRPNAALTKAAIVVDGQSQPGQAIALVNDLQEHWVEITGSSTAQ